MEEKKQLFRESTINRISSPEQLNDYIRVTNPGVWLLLTALLLLLAGALVWGFLGELETTQKVTAIVTNGEAVFYCANDNDFSTGMQVVLENGATNTISAVSSKPVSRADIEASYDEYALFELDPPEWAYTVTVPAPGIEDGITELSIVLNTIRPISFILN